MRRNPEETVDIAASAITVLFCLLFIVAGTVVVRVFMSSDKPFVEDFIRNAVTFILVFGLYTYFERKKKKEK